MFRCFIFIPDFRCHLQVLQFFQQGGAEVGRLLFDFFEREKPAFFRPQLICMVERIDIDRDRPSVGTAGFVGPVA